MLHSISSSTANTLQFVKQQKVSLFENIDATEEYCRAIIDQLFDFLNSKNIYAKNFKSPILPNKVLFSLKIRLYH